jgi:hypothetical protein
LFHLGFYSRSGGINHHYCWCHSLVSHALSSVSIRFLLWKVVSIPVRSFAETDLLGCWLPCTGSFPCYVSNVSITFLFFHWELFCIYAGTYFFMVESIVVQVFFGLIIIAGLGLIMKVETEYLKGMLYALISIIWEYCLRLRMVSWLKTWFLSDLLLWVHWGFLYFDLLFIQNKFSADFFILSFNNWMLILILASICTAYAFASVKWWKTEPLYGDADY